MFNFTFNAKSKHRAMAKLFSFPLLPCVLSLKALSVRHCYLNLYKTMVRIRLLSSVDAWRQGLRPILIKIWPVHSMDIYLAFARPINQGLANA